MSSDWVTSDLCASMLIIHHHSWSTFRQPCQRRLPASWTKLPINQPRLFTSQPRLSSSEMTLSASQSGLFNCLTRLSRSRSRMMMNRLACLHTGHWSPSHWTPVSLVFSDTNLLCLSNYCKQATIVKHIIYCLANCWLQNVWNVLSSIFYILLVEKCMNHYSFGDSSLLFYPLGKEW